MLIAKVIGNSSLFILFFFHAWSQDISIRGLMIDVESKQNLPYVHISVANSTIGTISDLEGRFVLRIPQSYQQEVILISHIGFKSRRLTIKELKADGKVFLTPDRTYLNEVVIKPTDTIEDVIRRIIQNIPKNYSDRDHIVKGFYREIERITDSTFIYISEARLDAYKFDYSKRRDQSPVRMNKGFNYSFLSDRVRRVEFYGGPHLPHTWDIIYTRSWFLSPSKINSYIFSIDNVVKYDDHELLVISFEYKRSDLKGKIYVTADTYAIVKVESNYTDRAHFYEIGNLLFKWSEGETVVDYQLIDGIWYLKNIYSIDHGIDKVLGADIIGANQFVVTEIDTANVEFFAEEEIIQFGDVFSRKIDQYDTTFWNTENVLLPRQDAVEYAKTIEMKGLVPKKKKSQIIDRFSFNFSPYYRQIKLHGHEASLQVAGVNDPIVGKVNSKDYSYGLYGNFRYNKRGLGFIGFDIFSSFPKKYDLIGFTFGKTKKLKLWKNNFLHGTTLEISTGFYGFRLQSKFTTIDSQSDLVLEGKTLKHGKIQIDYLMRGFEIPLSVGVNIPIGGLWFLSLGGGFNFSVGQNKHQIKFSEKEGFFLCRKSERVSLNYDLVELTIDDQITSTLPYDIGNFFFRIGFSFRY